MNDQFCASELARGCVKLGELPAEPLVSILMPNYNYGRYIGEAIESILLQSYRKWELIICDDGSTDGSCDVVEHYQRKDTRIRLIRKSNGGMASALNSAYKHSSGAIICLLDSDDLFAPIKIERIVESFHSFPQLGYITHKMRIIYGDGKVGMTIPIFTPTEAGYLGPKLYERGGRWRYMPESAICLRREVAEVVFPIDESRFRTEADAYVFTLSPILTSVGFIKEVLSFYRLHGRNITGADPLLSLQSIRKTIQDIERVVEGVNERLQFLGLPVIDVNRNVNYLEQQTFLLLVSSTDFSDTARQLAKLSIATARDDLYTPIQKLGRLLSYWSALLVPVRWRLHYLKFFYGMSLKGALHRIKALR